MTLVIFNSDFNMYFESFLLFVKAGEFYLRLLNSAGIFFANKSLLIVYCTNYGLRWQEKGNILMATL